MKKEQFDEITERLNRIEILLINQQFTMPKTDTSTIPECQHEWIEYNGTVKYRQCRKCNCWQYLT